MIVEPYVLHECYCTSDNSNLDQAIVVWLLELQVVTFSDFIQSL